MGKTIDHAYLLTKEEIHEELAILGTGSIIAPEGKRVVMTVDRAITPAVPGEYRGNICLELVDEMPKFGEFENDYRSALVVTETGVDRKRTVASAVSGALSDEALTDGTIHIAENKVNGISVTGGNFRVENTELTYEANGGDDFELYGTAIAVGGDAKVVVTDTEITTHGVAASAIQCGERSRVLVKDCTIASRGGDNTDYYTKRPHLTETPWVLGLKGTLRATNLLGDAHVCYYNTKASCDGWGVYSVDMAKEGKLTVINSDGIIPAGEGFDSGYGSYLMGIPSTFLGVYFDVPSYPLAAAGTPHTVVIGPSNQENLKKQGEELGLLKEELGGSLESVPERNSVLKGGQFIGMWHHQSGNDTYFEPGTVLEAGDTAFLIKSGKRTNSPNIHCDGVAITAPRLVHLMESDDAGIGTWTHDGSWAPCLEVIRKPEPTEGFDAAGKGEEKNAIVDFKDMTISGDCYNSIWSSSQNLELNFESCNYTGAISTAEADHKNVSYYYALDAEGNKICTDEKGRKYLTVTEECPMFHKLYTFPKEEQGNFIYDESDRNTYAPIGYGIWNTDAKYLGLVDVTPKETPCGGIIVTLSGGSRWEVTDTSHVTALYLEEGSTVCAPEGRSLVCTVDGIPTELLPGIYTGEIVLAAS